MRAIHGMVAIAVLLLASCASGGKLAPRAADQMRLGTQAAQRGYWQEALFRFQQARELDPANAEILNNVAVSLEALGKYEDALTTYKKALEVAPKNASVKRNYARFAEFYTSYARGVSPKGESGATH